MTMAGLSTEDFLTCHLCKRYYTDPRYLPCLHTLCKGCVAQDVRDTVGNTNTSQYVCPLCYKPVDFPRTNAPQNVIDGLPENAMVAGMVDVVQARNSIEVPCQPCARNKKDVDATHWCRSCGETLCAECTEFHHSLKKTMKHDVMDLATMRKMSIKDMMVPPTCPRHEDEVLNQYCDDHEVLICNICTATRHRVCRSVREVKDVVKMKQNGAKTLQDRLSEQTRGAEYVSEDRQAAVKHVDNNIASVLDEVKSLRKRINDMLEKCETEIVAELNEFATLEKERLGSQVRNSQSLFRATGNSKEILRQAKENGGDIHFLQWMNVIDNAIDEFSARFRSISTDMSKSNVSFVADNKLTSLTQNITRLGTLQVTNPSIPVKSRSVRSPSTYWPMKSRAVHSPIPSYRMKQRAIRSPSLSLPMKPRAIRSPTWSLPMKARSMPAITDSIVSNRLLRKTSRTRSLARSLTPYIDDLFLYDDDDDGRELRTSRKATSLLPVYSAKTSSDFLPCWLTGAVHLNTGVWVFADKNNRKLKMYDAHFEFKSERGMREEPFDLAPIDHGGFAVTVPDDKAIEIFSGMNGINPIRTLKTTEKCYGISIAYDKLAVTCPNMYPPAVRILMKDGTLLHHISPEEGYRPLLAKPLYVAWDGSGRSVYVTDTAKDRVVCLEANNNFKRFEYQHVTLRSPRGIAVGEGDTFYVCGWGTDNVQHVDSRGVFINEHLQRHDGIMGPQTVAVSRDYSKVVVTLDPTSCNSDIIFAFNT